MAKIELSQERSLVDSIIDIKVSGLEPNSEATLTLSMIDNSDNIWESNAAYITNSNGEIQLSTAFPIKGSYQKTDPMGLFWSMRDTSSSHGEIDSSLLEPFIYNLQISDSQKLLAEKTFERRWFNPTVIHETLENQEVFGEWWQPQDVPTGTPAIVVIGGSGGGIDGGRKKTPLLASHGYPALALGYFDYPGCPEHLKQIPLEYFEKAAQWVRNKLGPETPVVLWGGSRGGELTLLVGSYLNCYSGLVATAPSHVGWGGTDYQTDEDVAAWTFQGQDIPFAPFDGPDESKIKPGEAYSLSPQFLKAVAQLKYPDRVTIPVERIRVPLLMLSGDDDQMWPAGEFAKAVENRLREFDRGVLFGNYIYSETGHIFSSAILPTTERHQIIHPQNNGHYATGGTPEGSHKATIDSWAQVLRFLKHLSD